MKFLLLIVLATLASIATASADRMEHLTALQDVEYFQLDSETVERPFHIYVQLPEDYDETNQLYPTIYAIDGDILFPILAPYHMLLGYDDPLPKAIIVGVSYGAFGAENGNHRSTDYSTPPVPQDYREHSNDDGSENGGAAKYQSFLRDELIPQIEKRYRSNPAQRILIGQSRGAHFVLYSAYSDPDLFWGRIASNPALYPNKNYFFKDLSVMPESGSHLYFSSGEYDWPRLRADAEGLFAHLAEQKTTPWRLTTVTVKGGTHAADITNVYRAAMGWLFPATEDRQEN